MKYVATINEKEYLVEIIDDHHVNIDGHDYEIDFTSVSDQPVYSVLMNGKSFEAYVYQDEVLWVVVLHGSLYSIKVEDEREKRLREATGGNVVLTGDTPIKAPMPGLVISVLVEEGQQVAKGDTLLILESMKMQNELQSPRDGVVSRLKVDRGASVERHELICYVGNPK
ncbi:MAG: biotin/lipoyl-containing protein [Anaerolineales bacterium]|jgi:biotin carboxyl carrier protein